MGAGEEDGDAEEEGDDGAGQQDLSWATDC